VGKIEILKKLYSKTIRFLVISGGGLGAIYIFLKLYQIENVEVWLLNLGVGSLIFINCGFLIAGFTIVTALKPDKPIPWHWITLLVLAALNFIFVNVLPAMLVLASGVLELIKEL
jgi:hypothetical protein